MTSASRITGTQINYLLVCHRKLWLFSHSIHMEQESDVVGMGKVVAETTYVREEKEISIDDRIVLDWAEHEIGPDGMLTVHEVKKSKAIGRAHRLQMLYYLYVLKEKGVPARGRLDYPLLKQVVDIELTGPAEAEVETALAEVARIVALPEAPARLTSRRLCETCAYFELCWV